MSAPVHPSAFKLAQTPVERRERRPVSMRGFALLADGSTHEILLLDLSYEGCGIAIPVAVEPGDLILLSILGRGAIEAEVRWHADGKAGLVFGAMAEDSSKHHPRGHVREPLSAEVTVRRLGKANFRVTVFDLSPRGCRVELVERPAVGEHLLIKFAGLEILEAEVCWVDGASGGLRFEKPMHPAVFDLLLERLKGS